MVKQIKPIPKNLNGQSTSRLPIPNTEVEDDKILFSFSLLDLDNPYYNLNGMCDKGLKNCLEKLRLFSENTVQELFSSYNSTLRFHKHDKSKVDDWPDCLSAEDAEDSFYQIRFGTSKGGVHGVLIGRIFYIIWFDPNHWLYHNKRYGPKREMKKPGDCCLFFDSEKDTMRQKIEELEQKIVEYEELLEIKTNPNI